MKHLLFCVVLAVCGLFCAQHAFCDHIAAKGMWSEQDVRSILPAPPSASIEGNLLTVHLLDPLSDLTVTVTDHTTGKIIYQECISSPAGNYTIVLDAGKGNYTLAFTHKLGFLSGGFAIK